MMNIKRLLVICFGLLLFYTNLSCRKEKFNSTGNLSFSVDTLIFDTVFTTIGSTTKQFKLYNKDKKGLKIEEIQLMGGTNSPFRINVDGLKGVLHQNIEIEGKDSLFVFVEVTLNVNNQNLPLVVEDSIRFRTNGKDQFIHLIVWGQDAYFHYNEIMTENTIWDNSKPHVVYNYAAIDSAKTLTIQAGTKIHFHKNSILYVYKAKLDVQGEYENEVIFEGDRLENFYKDVYGQWYGIYFQEALSSSINYAIIKNGTSGIHLFNSNSTNTDYTLKIQNSMIYNHASYGVFSYAGAQIKLENCIIAKCRSNGILMLEGGAFNINHCHILGYTDNKSQNLAFAVKNYFTQNGITNVGNIPEGKIYNSVIYGYENDEFALDTLNPQNQVSLNFDFRNCLIKKEVEVTQTNFKNIIWNTNPDFKDIVKYDFTFTNSSILNAKGFQTVLNKDITGKNRNNPPDIGAYEIN
jgi:hypothetical protein